MNAIADILVATVALLLGLVFLASAAGLWKGLNQLRSVQRMHSRWGDRGVRIAHAILGIIMIAIAAVIAFGWRLFPADGPR